MVVGILVAVVAGVAICHTHHKKKQRLDAFQREYVARNGAPLTKEEWKQLCREHKQARKAEKHARKAEKHMLRADRRGCWRTSLPAGPAPAGEQTVPEKMDVKYATDGDMFAAPSQRQIRIPVQGPEEPPAYMPGSMTAPPEKM